MITQLWITVNAFCEVKGKMAIVNTLSRDFLDDRLNSLSDKAVAEGDRYYRES